MRRFWPSQSPDLTPPHFFQWGFLKQRVYSNSPIRLSRLLLLLLLALFNKFFKTLQMTLYKWRMLFFKKVGDIFSICCNYTLFYTFLESSKN
jgi:hypothetical protein